VPLDSARADEQLRADLWIRSSISGQPGDLLLLRRELVARVVPALARLLSRRPQLTPGAADELDVERLFTETTEAFGGVDVVVHAAAGPMILGPVADYDLGTFDALQRTNVRGTFVVNQQASRQLRDGGAIINFSRSVVGLALPTFAAYAASTGAAEAITPVLARELHGRDITVNTLAPGLKPPGTPAEIAKLVAFLVSEDGHWVNGQVIRVDGGIV